MFGRQMANIRREFAEIHETMKVRSEEIEFRKYEFHGAAIENGRTEEGVIVHSLPPAWEILCPTN
jgi:hypothetical protein